MSLCGICTYMHHILVSEAADCKFLRHNGDLDFRQHGWNRANMRSLGGIPLGDLTIDKGL